MSVSFSEVDVETRLGSRRVLVCQPQETLVVDRSRLWQLRSSTEPSPIDKEIAQRARQAGNVDVFLFRSMSSETNTSWAFDDDFNDPELVEAGMLVVASQRWLYRQLAMAGVFLIVGIEMGLRELQAFRHGTLRVLEDVDHEIAHTDPVPASLELDRWILRHLTFFSSLSLERVLKSLLPSELAMVERRVPRLRQLIEEAQPEAGA